MITLTVVFCMVANPYMCKSLPMGHWDYQAITSMTDCMMGGVIGGMTFTLENADWQVKGFRCTQDDTEKDTWLR